MLYGISANRLIQLSKELTCPISCHSVSTWTVLLRDIMQLNYNINRSARCEANKIIVTIRLAITATYYICNFMHILWDVTPILTLHNITKLVHANILLDMECADWVITFSRDWRTGICLPKYSSVQFEYLKSCSKNNKFPNW